MAYKLSDIKIMPISYYVIRGQMSDASELRPKS